MTPERGAAAMSALMQYKRITRQKEKTTLVERLPMSAPVKEQIGKIISQADGAGHSMLTEYEAKQIFSLCDIPVNAGILVASAEDAVAYFRRLSRPVVMKIVSPQIIHKTDAGCVKLNVQKEQGVVQSFEELLANARRYDPHAEIHGVLIQESVDASAIEVIIGASRDETFGPVLMFGLGGIFVESIRDVTFRAAPLTAADSLEMVRDIRGYNVLKKAAVSDVDLAKILLKVSVLLEQFEQIQELDINPLFADSSGVTAVDARILLA
jgi:acyl-CoA synthetase (NDP forming)